MGRLTLVFVTLLGNAVVAAPPADDCRVGAARVEITPQGPIRLTGYGSRLRESEGVEQAIWARAIAMGRGTEPPFVLVTLDVCGIPVELRNEAAARLEAAVKLPPDHLAVCATHSHVGPAVAGYAPMIHPDDPPPDQLQRIEAQTARILDAVVEAATRAIESSRPASLAWARGSVPFAANRRVIQDGKWKGFGVQDRSPVDHSLPVLFATSLDGKPIASIAGYACHCTTLDGDFNKVCGDWAGFASTKLEVDQPGTVALTVIGCGADANPQPRGTLELARKHGETLAAEIERLRQGPHTALPAPSTARLQTLELPFEPAPSLDQWKSQAERKDQVGRRARYYLDQIAHGQTVPTALPYTIQGWSFGDGLHMAFLAGEVVVDYANLLRERLDPARLWVVAYANGVPCYIPSKRILEEGGYEADDSMIYYNRPARLRPEVQDIIVNAASELAPQAFRRQP